MTRKSALVIEIIRGKTTVAEASRFHDLAPSEIENWVDDSRKGMENALRTGPGVITRALCRGIADNPAGPVLPPGQHILPQSFIHGRLVIGCPFSCKNDRRNRARQ